MRIVDICEVSREFGQSERKQPMQHAGFATVGSRSFVLILLVLLLLAGLPVAVWLDLRHVTETSLLRQANDVNSVVTSVRDYYADNIVSRVPDSPGSTKVAHNYEAVPGAIP